MAKPQAQASQSTAEQVVCFCKRHKLTANQKAGRAGGNERAAS